MRPRDDGGLPERAVTTNSPKLSISYSLADQDFATTKSVGIYNLSLGLLKALAADDRVERLSVFTNPSIDLRTALGVAVTAPRIDAIQYAGSRSRLARILWDQIGVYRAAKRAGNEWLLLPKGYSSFLLKPPVRLVTYVHDAMHAHYRTRHPGFTPALEMTYFWRAFLASLRNSSLILTNSQFTADELVRVCREQGIAPPPIVRAGIGFVAAGQVLAEKQARVLVLAGRWPHKLTRLAVGYLDRWQRETNYTGQVEWVGSFSEAVDLPAHGNWRRHLRLADGAYEALVASSKVLVYFSEYEGFGMPPIEAIIRGVAPVYSDIPACTEVMQGCGWSFKNESYESFARAMNDAQFVSADSLRTQADSLLALHSWEKVAHLVLRSLSASRLI